MPPVFSSKFEQDPSWVKYFRFYAKDLRKTKQQVRFSLNKRFDCSLCGRCCDFKTYQHRCLLSWMDVARWHAAGFDLGLFFMFAAHSIDGYAALGIPTKEELNSGKFLEWIRPLDEKHQICPKLPHMMKSLSTHLRNPSLLQVKNGECIYLGPDLRCLIHPIRPGACRLFPYVQEKIVQIAQEALPDFDKETNVSCPPNVFFSGATSPEDARQTSRDCAEAEAAARAQERISLPEVENLLVEIWREILPKF